MISAGWWSWVVGCGDGLFVVEVGGGSWLVVYIDPIRNFFW